MECLGCGTGDLRRIEIEAVACSTLIVATAVASGIGANHANPGKFFYENFIMGIRTMYYVHFYGVEKFVAIGTIAAYPKFTCLPFKEEDLWKDYPEEFNVTRFSTVW